MTARIIRKDAVWLGLFLLVGMVIHIGILLERWEQIWILPESGYHVAAALGLGMWAALLGLFQAMSDDLRRTREYLIHREVTLGRLFVARHLAGIGVVVVWTVVPLVVHLLFMLLVRPDRQLIEPGRIWGLLLMHLGALVGYATGAFIGGSSRRVLTLVIAVVPIALGVGIVLLLARLFGDSGALPHAGIIVIDLALIGLLGLGAYVGERSGFDADLPSSPARFWAVSVPATVALTACALLGIHTGQAGTHEGLVDHLYPRVHTTGDGSGIGLFRPTGSLFFPGWRTSGPQVDADHKPTGARDAKPGYLIFRPRTAAPYGQGGPSAGSARAPQPRPVTLGMYQGLMLVFHEATGQLEHIRFAGSQDSQGPFRRVRLNRPDRPFSRRARVLGNPVGRQERVIIVADDEDGTVWRVDVEAATPIVERLALPAGDRYLRPLRSIAPYYEPEPVHVPGPAVEGARGIYLFDDGQFVAATGPVLATLQERSRRMAHETEAQTLYWDPIHTRVVVPARGSRPAFEHVYAPRTGLEKTFSALLHAFTLVRPPLLAAVSATRPAKWRAIQMITIDPLLTGGRRPLLLAGTIALGLLLAGLAAWRMAALGAPRPRIIAWAATVALTGVSGYIAFRLLEPRRAWAKAPLATAAQPAPALILQSA